MTMTLEAKSSDDVWYVLARGLTQYDSTKHYDAEFLLY
jgi:hypothetical protein